MKASRQLTLGPMPLQEIASPMASAGNSIATADDRSVNVCDLSLMAFQRIGLDAQQAAGKLGMTPPQFTKAFGNNWPEHNPVMKRMGAKAGRRFWREFALLLCEDLGLSVNGPDVERHALADVLEACASYVRVMSR